MVTNSNCINFKIKFLNAVVNCSFNSSLFSKFTIREWRKMFFHIFSVIAQFTKQPDHLYRNKLADIDMLADGCFNYIDDVYLPNFTRCLFSPQATHIFYYLN